MEFGSKHANWSPLAVRRLLKGKSHIFVALSLFVESGGTAKQERCSDEVD
jgi:hypothetical protein